MSFQNIDVAVVIPTFNRAELLLRTVRSVLAQTQVPREIIVVDDGGKDDTQARLAELCRETGANVRYLRQENQGQSPARNNGAQNSESPFLLFLDSDDLLLPDALERLTKALAAEPDAVVAYGRSQTIDGNDNITETSWNVEDAEGRVWERLVRGNFVRTPGLALIRRTALAQVGIWNKEEKIRGSDDWEMWLRLSEIGDFVRVAEPVLQYRVHGANMSANALKMHNQARELLKMEETRQRRAGASAQKIARVHEAIRVARRFTAHLYAEQIAQARAGGDGERARKLVRLFFHAEPSRATLWVLRGVLDVLFSLLPRGGQRIKRALFNAVLAPYHRLPLGVRRSIRRRMGIADP